MTNDSLAHDVLGPAQEPARRTETLSVLTVLTFIGCALELYFGVNNFLHAADNYQKIQEAREKLSDSASWMQSLVGPDILEAARRSVEYRTPILVLCVVGVGLCAWGAFRMRSLVKTGFYFYVIGELFPFLGNFIVPPHGSLTIITLVFGFIIAGVFIVLYSGQVKYMR